MELPGLIEDVGVEAMANATGVSARAVRAWRLGSRHPRPETAQRILEAFPDRTTFAEIYARAGKRIYAGAKRQAAAA